MSRTRQNPLLSRLLILILLATLSIFTTAAMAIDTDSDGIDDEIEQTVTGTDYQNDDTDGDGLLDGTEDIDQDGIQDASETSPVDADTDDDGLSDGDEDVNMNGIVNLGETNPRDPDSDNDGLNDGLETGRTKATDVDSGVSSPGGISYAGTAASWIADSNPSTTTDPLDSNTDDDAILDGDEDANQNGNMDGGETNPVDADTDDDGLSDGDEDVNMNGIVNLGETNPLDPDSDNDGLNDGLELGRTIPISGEISQGIGIPYAGTDGGWVGDADQTTETDPRDADTDNDGLLDGDEDTNHNGNVDGGETNPVDADTDDDGLSDGDEDVNMDGSVDAGETDPLDDDSDNDGLNDGLELGRTTPIPDGISDSLYIVYPGTAGGWVGDADSSTTTDPLDSDTDNDGLLDGDEDTNHNGNVDGGEMDPTVSDDVDEDGYYSDASGGDDCDDGNPDIYPDAKEICDGVDNNCDGAVDEGCGVLLINEVYYDEPGADGTNVFIELYSTADISLAGYSLKGINDDGSEYMSIDFPGGVNIATGEHFLIVTNSADASLMAIADFVTDYANLQNGPDSLVLKDSMETPIDTLGYGTLTSVYETAPAVDATSGNSLSRDSIHTDTDDNSVDFTETSPTPKANISPDTDDDGLTDAEEAQLGTNPNSADSDGDNLDDYYEVFDSGGSVASPTNTDGDSQIDALDSDDDGDSVPTLDEDLDSNMDPTNDDTDGDNVPNYLDTDDDGDGILTVDEDIDCDGDVTGDYDVDHDGIVNYLDWDDDGDGLGTDEEYGTDSDSDGLDDYLESDIVGSGVSVYQYDDDDDDDGKSTASEDTNGNGCYYDDDDDGDGIPDFLDDTFTIPCDYILAGDVNGDCKINLMDFSIMAVNWLVDCAEEPLDPDCVPKNPVAPCDHDGFTAVSNSAIYDGSTPAMLYTASSSGSSPSDNLMVEIDQSIGGPSSPETYILTGENYSSAAVNVLVLSNCDGGMVCSKTFLAQSGTLDITSIGGIGSTFAGTLSNVILIEVTIDPGTFDSTPVANGDKWCITDYAFNVTVE